MNPGDNVIVILKNENVAKALTYSGELVHEDKFNICISQDNSSVIFIKKEDILIYTKDYELGLEEYNNWLKKNKTREIYKLEG